MKIRYLNDGTMYLYTFNIIDAVPNECSAFIEVLNNNDNLITFNNNSNNQILVNINILPKGEISRLCKCIIHVINTYNKENIYEELWYINRNINLNADTISKYTLKKDLIYRDLVLMSFYNKAYRDLFTDMDSLDEKDNLIYQPNDMCYIGTNNSYFIQSILSNDSNGYRDFLVHIETENDNYRIEYSLDNRNTWIEINNDEDIHVDQDIVNLDIKVTLTGDNTIYSYGVLYDLNVF